MGCIDCQRRRCILGIRASANGAAAAADFAGESRQFVCVSRVSCFLGSGPRRDDVRCPWAPLGVLFYLSSVLCLSFFYLLVHSRVVDVENLTSLELMILIHPNENRRWQFQGFITLIFVCLFFFCSLDKKHNRHFVWFCLFFFVFLRNKIVVPRVFFLFFHVVQKK